MLHAFSNADGSEKWAFIPPSLIPKLRGVNSGKANKTNSIYGVDGSPVIKIFIITVHGKLWLSLEWVKVK